MNSQQVKFIIDYVVESARKGLRMIAVFEAEITAGTMSVEEVTPGIEDIKYQVACGIDRACIMLQQQSEDVVGIDNRNDNEKQFMAALRANCSEAIEELIERADNIGRSLFAIVETIKFINLRESLTFKNSPEEYKKEVEDEINGYKARLVEYVIGTAPWIMNYFRVVEPSDPRYKVLRDSIDVFFTLSGIMQRGVTIVVQ